ncbi:alanine racemase [Desulfurispirillum indicum S5]|uniref:Alanine racemase n=1 Tax=Desulfurispirillum indicum (strain ATCC BAA-1389 / DSM 22839 / S5) TaxID=653733 RepID=E6W1R1_DESIS|nr:alanine racemase [Desulfurispirillum indicum]ADU65443.1 alanine racemase [Desulfurispirillum indicum S5]
MKTIFCEIHLPHIRHNFRLLQQRAGHTRIVGVVKADAYGHGDVPVALCLQSEGCTHFAVARVHEGIKLRKAGIHGDILIMSGSFPNEFAALREFNLTTVVYCEENIEEMVREGISVPVHIKINTGMNRLGFRPDRLPWVYRTLTEAGFAVRGIMTHMACADEPGSPTIGAQENLFYRSLEPYFQEGMLGHLSNSAGIFTLDNLGSLARPGIMLYGGNPFADKTVDLRPAMTFKTKILQVKRVFPGEGISYGHSFVADREMLVATVAAGYADGYSRLLSNKARVLVNGQYAPQVGRVCMDMSMVDVTHIQPARGDEVVLFGEQRGQCIYASELAELMGTIDYEVFCGISPRVKRIYTGA